jgi:hypothetical protein
MRSRQQDDAVTYSFEIMNEMRREHDRKIAIGDGFGQGRQKLSSRQWIEPSDRLVEKQHLRPLGERQTESNL